MLKGKKGGFVVVWVIIIVIVIGLIVWAIVEHQASVPGQPVTQTAPSSTPPAIAPTDSIQQYSDGQLPPGMPSDIILASDAQILNSYTGVTPQGKQQSTVVYSTSQSQFKIFSAYYAYLTLNKWAISQLSGTQSLSAVSSGTQMSIDISPATSSVTVDVIILK
jgi:hypothetical protein